MKTLGFTVLLSSLFTAWAASQGTGAQEILPQSIVYITNGGRTVAVEFSSDGKSLFSYIASPGIHFNENREDWFKIYEIATCKERSSQPVPMRGDSEVRHVAVSHDGSHVAVSSFWKELNKEQVNSLRGQVTILDTKSGKTQILLRYKDQLVALCFSRNGKYLAVGLGSHGLRVISVDSGDEVLSVPIVADTVAFLHDDKLVASVGSKLMADGKTISTFTFHAIAARKLERSLVVDGGPFEQFFVLADGDKALLRSHQGQVEVRNLRDRDGMVAGEVVERAVRADSIALSHDGKAYVLAYVLGGRDPRSIVKVRGLDNKQDITSWELKRQAITAWGLSPDATRIAGAGRGFINDEGKEFIKFWKLPAR